MQTVLSAQRANRVRRGQTTLGEGKPDRKEGEIHGERKRKPCVEKVNHVEVDHVEGGGKLWRRGEECNHAGRGKNHAGSQIMCVDGKQRWLRVITR